MKSDVPWIRHGLRVIRMVSELHRRLAAMVEKADNQEHQAPGFRAGRPRRIFR